MSLYVHNDTRVQREQILGKPGGDLTPGPPEAHFNLDPSELRDELEKELQHLRQDKARLEGQLQVARQQVVQNKDGFFEVDSPTFLLSGECLFLCVHTSSV